MLFTISRSEAH